MYLLNYNYVLFLTDFKYLLILFFFILFNASSNANVFLRLRNNLLENSSELKFDENLRERRSLNVDWRLKIKEKAITFGQSKKEIDRVYYYLQLLNEAEIKKHSLRHNNSSFDDKIKKQLNLWQSRRLFDHKKVVKKNIVAEENSRYFEGDIVLTSDQAKELYERSTFSKKQRVKRKFIGSSVRRWDSNQPIIFSFDGSHTLQEQRVIELALEHWHNITCLNFEKRNDEPKGNRIVFTDVDGCASNVGKHPLGEPQFVSLAPECIRLGVIAHEVSHALGFWHEQSRPDRDFFVQVQWDNIDKDSKGQFLKEQPADVDNYDVPYDYGSIMHYRSKAFAKYDDYFTMNTYISDYQRTIGQRDQLSFNDIRLMNSIYCRNTCSIKLPCQRGGYTDPRHCDRCRCPDGFTGKLCNEVMPGYGDKCGGKLELKSNMEWQYIHSPNYPQEFNKGQECSWLIVAPHGQHVQLKFIGEFEIYCKVRHSLCMDYVEIRNSTDFANTGMRYCCYGTPNSSIVSATEDMLLLFRSFYRGNKGFQAQVRAIPRTGEWNEWAESAACSASCGACGTKQRRRTCNPPNAFCLGNDTDIEVCNRKPCKGECSRKRIEDSECTGFLSLLKGIRCKKEKTHLEECNEICCAGFSLVDGLCTR